MFVTVQKYAEAFAEACNLVEVAGYVWRSVLTSSKYVFFFWATLEMLGNVRKCSDLVGKCVCNVWKVEKTDMPGAI